MGILSLILLLTIALECRGVSELSGNRALLQLPGKNRPEPPGRYFPPSTSSSIVEIDSEYGTVPPELLDLHYLPTKNCSCAEPKSCGPVYVDRKRENIIQVSGASGGTKTTTVELIKEEIRERPAPRIEYEIREVMDMQKIPKPMTANVTLEREIVKEKVIYQEIIINKVEINYKYVDRTIYVEVEEPEVSYDVTVEPFPVVLDHETVTFSHDTFKVNLTEEYLDPKGMPLVVKERMDEIVEEPIETVETVICNSIRYVSVPCYPPGQKVPGAAGPN